MPPLARKRNAKKSSTTPGRRKAADAIKKEKKAKEICPICRDDMQKMRTVTLQPCSHSFHRTCLLQYFEIKNKTREQTCPCCRSRPKTIQSEQRTIEYVQALGSLGQPTRFYLNNMKRLYYEGCTCAVAKMLRKWNWHDEIVLREHREAADKKKGAEWLADIEMEAAKLKKRRTIIGQMLDCAEIDHAALEGSDVPYAEWNYSEELRRAKKHLEERRKAVREKMNNPDRVCLNSMRPRAPDATLVVAYGSEAFPYGFHVRRSLDSDSGSDSSNADADVDTDDIVDDEEPDMEEDAPEPTLGEREAAAPDADDAPVEDAIVFAEEHKEATVTTPQESRLLSLSSIGSFVGRIIGYKQ